MSPKHPAAEENALKREAYQWVMRLTSGEATAADAEALHRWRQTSRAHRRAFAEANRLWDKLGPAAIEVAEREATAHPEREGWHQTPDRPLTRRAVLGSALAAAAGYAIVHPPLQLWPSFAEMTADYRTGVGQQQRIALKNVAVTLNTRTSMAVLPQESDTGQANQVELIDGEANVATTPDTVKPFVVVAAQGRTIATHARFNVRLDDTNVCVTCLDGDVRVEHLGQASTVRSREQIVYTASKLGPVVGADPDTVTAWQRGLLVFRDVPLASVVDEVNRYRPGKIILMNEELGRRPILATFRIDRIEEVIPRMQAVFGVRVRALPGGIVLLS